MLAPFHVESMPDPRFFWPQPPGAEGAIPGLEPLAPNARLALPEPLAHHALRVLRLRDGQAITLFDGRGGEYPARLQVQGRQAWALTGRHQPIERELAGQLTLCQGLPSGDKMDWVVEKAVELGASRLLPIAAERSVLKLSGERLDKRLARWRAIARAASEQCGRNRIMPVDAPLGLAQALAGATAGEPRHAALFCHPEAHSDMAQALAASAAAGPLQAVTLFIGPEGGWSDAELGMALSAGLEPLNAGPRILRTETAGLALMSACTAQLAW